jgi:large subunit ribosomal protein L24
VAGINVVKKHQKPSAQGTGGIVDKELSVHISNVSAIDPKSGKVTKIGFKVLKDGKKARVARKSGETLSS